MKRRNPTPAIPPFIDVFGRPTYENPFGHNRPNPALNTAAPAAPVMQPIVTNESAAVVQPSVVVAPAVVTDPAATTEPVVVAEPVVITTSVAPTATIITTIASEMPAVVAENTAAPRLQLHLHTTTNAGDTLDTTYPGFDTTSPAYDAAHARLRKAMGFDPDLPAASDELSAGRRSEQRARLHRRVRRSAAVVAAVGSGLVGITAAAAYFTAHGAGAGSATAGTLQPVTVAATVGGDTPSSSLLPGGSADVILRVHNSNSFGVTLVSVSPNGNASAPGCTTTGVTFTNQSSLNIAIPSGTTLVHLAGAAGMDSTSSSDCQGATFTIPVSITVHK